MEPDLAIHEADARGAAEVSSPPTDEESGPEDQGANKAIIAYLLAEVEEFQELSRLRLKGWSNSEGDRFFLRQRDQADATSLTTSKKAMRSANFFFKMMQDVGGQLDGSTRVFKVAEPAGDQPRFLDLCMAPGGILSRIMKRNPGATATAYSLPVDVGGYEVLFKSPDVKTEMLDITMLAADLGVDSIPEGHLDANNFLPKQFHEGRLFDIVLCDGQVLRTQERPAYRKRHEARRLMVTQLVLGLEHLSPGGTMIILLHKPEKPASVELLRQFHRFSSVRLFKPPKAHAKRSSFYMIASNVQVEHPQAVAAVDEWKRTWKITTFGSEEEIEEHIQKDSSWAEEILEDFGPVLVDIGRSVWSIQAKALAEAPFIAGSSGRPQTSGQWGRKY